MGADSKLALKVESTGMPALDALLGGGIPAQSLTVIAGEPGSGKTILTLQMLFHAAKQGRKCLYFTTISEPAVKVLRYMQTLDFFDADALEQRITLCDLGGAIRKGASATLAEIAARVEALEPSLVAIDSFRAVAEMLPDVATARHFVYEAANHMTGWGATVLLVGEYLREEQRQFAEFAIADGILRLGTARQELTSVREIEVVKLRGAHHASGRHFFDISARGIYVYPRVQAPEPRDGTPVARERDSTGLAGLDELLDGGLPRGSSTVVQGGTGTGKTLLALHFALEGVRQGHKTAFFTMEETPAQLRAIASGLGMDLAAHEASGHLILNYSSPVELSTDRYLNEARMLVEELGARRVVFDSLTAMAVGVPSERRFKELVYAISKHMRRLDASLLMTMEAEQLLGSSNLSGLGVSFVADNLIQLRYIEMDGRLERAISVIKARGIAVNSELRSAMIGAGGMTVVGERFKDLRGVLTGLPARVERTR
jgi:circadian clock protein KaiC